MSAPHLVTRPRTNNAPASNTGTPCAGPEIDGTRLGVIGTRTNATNAAQSHRQTRTSLTFEETDSDLRSGIDPGDPLTAKGRIKKRIRDKDSFDVDDPDRYRYKSYHIRRAFDLYGHLPTIINDGIKRRAKESSGEDGRDVQSDREYESFKLIIDHLEGLSEDIVRLKRSPKSFRTLTRKIREAADQARNNDTANLKKDIACMLTPDGSSVLTVVMKGKKASSKHDRGFDNEVMGRYLCPISMDWDDPVVKDDIKEGKRAILACDWPRLLYADCECNIDDLELGLGRNMALVRVVKYLFTGRSAAFSESAGGKTTRSGNAALAGMKAVTPRVVAYAACMLRYAISNEETWSNMDKEFNMQEFYWHVVNIFDDSGDFGKDLLAWWNTKIFGTSTATTLGTDIPAAPVAISLLKMQRQAKRNANRVLGDVTNTESSRRIRELSVESEDGAAELISQSPRLQEVPNAPLRAESEKSTSASPPRRRATSQQSDSQEPESRHQSPVPQVPQTSPSRHIQHQNPAAYQRQHTFHPSALYYPAMANPHHIQAVGPGPYHHARGFIPGAPPMPPWYPIANPPSTG